MKIALTLLLLLHLKLLQCESETYPDERLQISREKTSKTDQIEQNKFFLQTAHKLLTVSEAYLIELKEKIDSSKATEKEHLTAISQRALVEYQRLTNILASKKKETPIANMDEDSMNRQQTFCNQFLVDVLELNNFLEDVLSQNPQ
jgi:hypothetical protein